MELKYTTNPASATSFPGNVGYLGTGMMGVSPTIGAALGTPFHQAGTGNPVNLNDDDLISRVDNYNGATVVGNSYLGYTWPAPQTVKSMSITFATFLDGGWFGPNNSGPGGGQPLGAAHLAEPTAQVSFDGGVTWEDAPHTSDYMTVMLGHLIGGGAVANPSSRTATFTLNTEARGVTGFRIIGSEGGTASGGFIGAFEATVTSGGTGTDLDNDWLPDAWEVAGYGSVHAQHLRSDLDFDGSDNLLEYSLGLDPNKSDFPAGAVVENDFLTITITKKPGIGYMVTSGEDLTGMTAAETIVVTDNETTLKVTDSIPFSAGLRRFMRTTVEPWP
jgi:hypothetical protein